MVETVLQLAARRKETVELIYLDRKGCLTQRRVRILELGEAEVRVFCWERKAFRRLRREGILAAERKERRRQPGKNVSFL
ncbi:hypothetical protein HMPREF9374_0730 [Desmospora sp. 8437]|nr:hypothetical protein HMPREF9374_0730 [Desmospora sp. 8437]